MNKTQLFSQVTLKDASWVSKCKTQLKVYPRKNVEAMKPQEEACEYQEHSRTFLPQS